jgi:hypothetical protein
MMKRIAAVLLLVAAGNWKPFAIDTLRRASQ